MVSWLLFGVVGYYFVVCYLLFCYLFFVLCVSGLLFACFVALFAYFTVAWAFGLLFRFLAVLGCEVDF